jgi:putative Holliday junction resolvase
MRILAIDPGDKRLGIAISDETATLARPLMIINHVSRQVDAAAIATLAGEHGAEKIIIGQALDDDLQPTPQGRKAQRLARMLESQTSLPVVLWDESGSTQAARRQHILMGGSWRQRRQRGHGHLDDLAAVQVLQDYLDHHQESRTTGNIID